MKQRFLVWLLFFLISPSIEAQPNEEYLKVGKALLQQGLISEGSFEILAEIVAVGPRFSGTPGKAAAVELASQLLRDLGLDRVWLEPVTVPRWVRSPVEEARVVGSRRVGDAPLTIAALGGSVATLASGLTAPVVEVHSFDELQKLGNRAKGKIIFYNRPMDRTSVNTFAAYSGAVDQRAQGAVQAARQGAVGVLVRSLTLRLDDYPHTGGMSYQEGVPKIPAASISTRGAELLSALLKQEKTVEVFMRFTPQNLDSVRTSNVIGELTGSAYPDQIVLLAAHLDTWDITPGAHDNGAGCAQVIHGLKLLRQLGLRPQRTIRGVLFANEEFGLSGGIAYAASEHRVGERHLAAIESDRGGFLPLGFTIDSRDKVVEAFQRYQYLFEPFGMHRLIRGFGGADIMPLRDQGTLAIGLLPDSQRYFDLHHSAKDILAEVNPRELELGTAAMALLAYILAEEGLPVD